MTALYLRGKARSFFGRLLCTALAVCGLGMASGQTSAKTVTVDSAPLIVQASLPPNIVLMLDDSGSMDYDYMPDTLSDTTIDGKRNSGVNGTYYNPDPSVIYSPPPMADGKSSYPNSPDLTSAFEDGFTNQDNLVDVTSYSDSFKYYTQLSISKKTYEAIPDCDNGYTYNSGTEKCEFTKYGNVYKSDPDWDCKSGDGYPDSNNQCSTTKWNFFTFTTGVKGNYTQHYVGTSGSCALLTNTTAKANCKDDETSRQKVANWFSYYRKRMLMAKSGLLSAFSGVSANYRIGFGSINNNNSAGVRATGNYTDDYNDKYIAKVRPFGDGGPSTQKAKFWAWVNDIPANNGTPLRRSLDAVGQYYKGADAWTTMSSDPNPDDDTELACRQSYTVLTTDGFWNGSDPSNVDDEDGAAGPVNKDPNGVTLQYQPRAPYTDGVAGTKTYSHYQSSSNNCKSAYSSLTGSLSGYKTSYYNSNTHTCSFEYSAAGASYSDTLADVAMKYWNTDLRPDTKNEVPTSTPADPAFWQHMTTFTLGMGFDPQYADGTLIPMSDVWAWAYDPSKTISNFEWPKPSADSPNNIADLAHAAVNGHGGFYSAKSPEAFASGLKDALKRASERVGTGASLAANSTQLQTGTMVYQANYYTAKWKGDLKAFAVDSTDGSIAPTPTWLASSQMPATSNSSRNIYTYNPDGAAGSKYVAFKLAGDGSLPALSASQNTALSTLGGGTTSEAQMINYLRGDDSKEQRNGGSYRNRDTPLGDIVDSQPIYVGAPNPNEFVNQKFTGTTDFAAYASDQHNRAGLIFVAANDGMLHAFYADDTSGEGNGGKEAYAYLPGAVITSGTLGTSGLTALADPAYGTDAIPHQYFNDGELTVADAYVGGKWKTILVGTTGRGLAKAVYALDVTDPSAITLLWERSAADGGIYKYLGQMTGKPVIAQTADGTWSVLMGNGYNSEAGKAALLQFALSSGDLKVYETSDDTGLAAPAVWMDPSGNGVSTIAYAGDADGNVWSFSLSAGTVTKLYTAKDASNAQPITAGMLIGKDPQTGNVWLFFGTGKYLASSDLADLSVQTWYGLIVQSSDLTNSPVVTSTMTRADLAKRSITAEQAASGDALAARTVTTAADADAMTGKSGWYIDLVSPGQNGEQGERMVTPNQFQGNLLLGTTRIPKASDPCDPSGTGWIMAIDPFTGTNPPAPFFDVNGDGQVDDTLNGVPVAGLGFGSLPNNPIFVGSNMLTSFDNGTNSSRKTNNNSGKPARISWRELINQ